MEAQIKNKLDYQMTVDRKVAGKEAKKKALIEQQRLKLEDLAEKEALNNAGLLDSDDESDLDSDDRAYKEAAEADKKKEMIAGHDNESSGGDSEADEAQQGLFVNPLLKKNKAKAEESDEWSDDYSEKDGKGQKGSKRKDKKEKTILGKRKRKGSIDDI